MNGEVRRLLKVLACLVSVFAAFMVWRGLNLASDVDDLKADVASLSSAYESARDADPTLPPAKEIIDNPTAPIPGPAGRDGRDGRNGRDGADGFTPDCWYTASQCVGPQGPAGADGAPGVDGTDGTDGADGATGAQGETGPTGPPGPTCPDGYSLQPDTLRGDDVMVCTKDQPQ